MKTNDWPKVVYEDVLDADVIEDPMCVVLDLGPGTMFLMTDNGPIELGTSTDFEVEVKP